MRTWLAIFVCMKSKLSSEPLSHLVSTGMQQQFEDALKLLLPTDKESSRPVGCFPIIRNDEHNTSFATE